MKKKHVKIISLFIIVLSLFSGCSKETIPVSTNNSKSNISSNEKENLKDENISLKTDNDHVKILCNSNIVIAVNELVDFYCSENNLQKDIFDIKIMNEDTSGDEEYYDMIFNDTDSIYSVTDDSNLDVIDLSKTGLSEKELSCIYSGILEAGRNSEKEIKSVPVIIEPVVFCYRADIADDFFDFNEKDMQEATENWNSFRYVAKDVFEQTDNDIKICTLKEIKDYYTDMSHTSFLKNNCLEISDKLIEGYEYIREFKNEGYASDCEVGSDEWKEAVLSDEIFGFFADFYDERADRINEIMSDEYIRRNQSWKCVKGPECMIKKGVWVSIGAKSVNNDKAADFIRFYTVNDEIVKKYALQNRRYMSNCKVMKNIIENEEYDGVKWIRSQSEHFILDDVASSFKAVNDKTVYDKDLMNNYRESLDLFCNGEYALAEDAADGFKMMSENLLYKNGFSVELMSD